MDPGLGLNRRVPQAGHWGQVVWLCASADGGFAARSREFHWGPPQVMGQMLSESLRVKVRVVVMVLEVARRMTRTRKNYEHPIHILNMKKKETKGPDATSKLHW